MEYIIEDNAVNTRIDVFLNDKLTEYSRNYIKKLIDTEKILLNGEKTKASYKLRLNDKITLLDIEPVELDVVAENIPLDIVYEDDDLIVVNKPQGMVVHPAPGNYTNTLVNALLYHCKDSLSGINGTLRPGIVHRIDKDTSGLLVVTKNDNAHKFLAAQFKEHSILREYHAIVINNVTQDKGTVDKPLNRDIHDRRKRAIDIYNGKNAVTHYEVLERFSKFTYIKATLETGRTHQIRVHMTSIGNPILGDPIYTHYKSKLNLSGQLLHAKNLGFIHPTTKEYVTFDSELPPHFIKALNYIRKG